MAGKSLPLQRELALCPADATNACAPPRHTRLVSRPWHGVEPVEDAHGKLKPRRRVTLGGLIRVFAISVVYC